MSELKCVRQKEIQSRGADGGASGSSAVCAGSAAAADDQQAGEHQLIGDGSSRLSLKPKRIAILPFEAPRILLNACWIQGSRGSA